MRHAKTILFAVLILTAGLPHAWAETEVRIATYNIKFLDTNFQGEGNRLDKLRQVIELLEADIIGLQEIDDRAALELLFDPVDWHIIIDNDSGNRQDLALVVSNELEVLGFGPQGNLDLDADDQHFLFPGSPNNNFFPNRRDLLAVEVRLPDEEDLSFFVMVTHAKSRFGGRADTDSRREGASQSIVQKLEADFHEALVILLGDFNDNCDDRSLNILETGDPNAMGGPEQIEGPFLINITEPLCAAGHVSHGRKTNEIDPVTGLVDTIDSGSRQRNNQGRGTNANTGDIMFDQLLVSNSMFQHYVAASAAVFNQAVGVTGNNRTRASDHLPVYADFSFEAQFDPDPPIDGLRIVRLLPNPAGKDAGNEQVTLTNFGQQDIDLSNWKLRDRAGNEFSLSNLSNTTIQAGESRTITMDTFSMPLNNSGDTITLIEGQDTARHSVSYTGGQVESGQAIEFQ